MSIKILTLIKKQQFEEGFTLLEVLVTMAIIGLLFTVSSAIFVNTIRSANKANITNEAKENSSLVLESLERDIHNASGVSPFGTTTTITTKDASGTALVTWTCQGPTPTANGYITREVGSSGALTVTNRDPVNGVNLNFCSFSVAGGGLTSLVTINISFIEGKGVVGASQDISTLVSHKASFSARGY